MTHTSLNQWIKASEFQRGTPASHGMRACLHAAVNTMHSGFKAVVAERHLSELYGFAKRAPHPQNDRLEVDQRAATAGTAVVFGAQSAKIFASALVVIAGVVAFDLAILWIAAGRVIDHLPL
jgi:hypothetical protein